MYSVRESPCILKIYMDHNYKTTQMLGRFVYSRNKSTYELSDYKIHRNLTISRLTQVLSIYLTCLFSIPYIFGWKKDDKF